MDNVDILASVVALLFANSEMCGARDTSYSQSLSPSQVCEHGQSSSIAVNTIAESERSYQL